MTADNAAVLRTGRGKGAFARRLLAMFAAACALSLAAVAVSQSTAFADQYLGEPYTADGTGIATLANEQAGTVYVTGTNNQNEARKLLDLVNAARSSATAPAAALKWDPALEKAAIQRAAELSVYYSHTRPNDSSCFTAVGTPGYTVFGENIAAGYRSVADVNTGWTNSSGHYANMVSQDFTGMGAAVFTVSGVSYWVELFGKPVSSSAAIAAVTGTQTHGVAAVPRLLGLSMTGDLGGTRVKGSTAQMAVKNQNKGWDKVAPIALKANSFNWTSSNSGIATVNGSGVATVAGGGTVTVTATCKDAVSVKVSRSVTIALASNGSTSSTTSKEGWVLSGNRWWWRNADGSYPRNTAKVIGGATYRFDNAGWMRTGWVLDNNKWYYHNSSGAMAKGWAFVGRAWYYLEPSTGIMHTGWKDIGNTRYYLDGSGAMRTGWLKLSNKWYYLQGSGAMAKGWAFVGRAWYYLDPSDGAMRTSWQDISGKRYYLDGSGAMRTGWLYLGNKWYWMDGSGAMAKSRWISGIYWVGADGVMATNAWVDNSRYYVNGSGAWVPGARR